eukprot:Em0001g259a
MEIDDKRGGYSEEVKSKPLKPREFTWKELSQLNGRHNAHVAVRGKVYDVSSFVSRHPGGVDQIMLGAGRDVTQVFESYHSFETHKILDKFYVGVLVDNELPVFPPPSKFYQTVKKRVDDYFKSANIDPKIDYWMFLRYAVFMVVAISFWVGGIVFRESLAVVVAFGLVGGFFNALIIMTCVHDSSHFAVTHKPWVWKLVGGIHDFYVGASMYIWTYQHIVGHHLYTNIDGADPDIITSSLEVSDIRRIKWTQKWLPRYFYQHIYIPLLYCVFTIKTRLQDFLILLGQRNGNIRMNPPSLTQLLIFYGGKLTYVTHRFIIPLIFMPWTTVLLLYFMTEISTSYWLALTFQASHVISEVEWPTPGQNNLMQIDWAEMQVATTQDYATDSWFWTVVTGALNHQTTHHLFPGVLQSHYMKITPIVKKTCEEFGVKYHHVNTTTEALGCHINHLKVLGQGSKKHPE